jgi:hypothetical protein
MGEEDWQKNNDIMGYKIAIVLLTEGLVAKGIDILDIPIILKDLASDYKKEIKLNK